MDEYPERIIGIEKLVDWFGYWPSFHDAEVTWIIAKKGQELLQGNVIIEFLVHTWEWELPKSKFEKKLVMSKSCLAHFAFKHCADIDLHDFNQQNQLSTIEFKIEKQVTSINNVTPVNAVVEIRDGQQYTPEEVLTVTFISEFGLEGGFKCFSGEIINVIPCDQNGNPLLEKPKG